MVRGQRSNQLSYVPKLQKQPGFAAYSVPAFASFGSKPEITATPQAYQNSAAPWRATSRYFIPFSTLMSGQVRWASVDSSWVHDVDREKFGASLDRWRALEPSRIYSSHLPPAPGSMLDLFVEALSQVPDAPRFEGLDQAALEMMLAGAVGS